MAAQKKVKAHLKLVIMGGSASAAPPIGPALAPYGLNLQEFIKKFNDATAQKKGMPQRALVTLYEDRTFDLEVKDTPVTTLLKKAAGVTKGSGNVPKATAGTIHRTQIAEIAKQKLADFNTDDLDAAMKMVEGAARSLGLSVTE